MQTFAQDLRYAFRTFARRPASRPRLLSIALGIGANTAIFSVASALLLRPLRIRTPIGWSSSGTARPAWASPRTGSPRRNTSTSRPAHHGFEQVAIAIGGNDNLTGDGEPERVGTIRVSSNLLPMLGARAGARTAVHARGGRRQAPRPPPCSVTARGCAATAAIRRSVGTVHHR